MIQEMSDRHLAPRTIATYVYWIAKLAKHYRACPSLLTDDQINLYLREELIREKMRPGVRLIRLSARSGF